MITNTAYNNFILFAYSGETRDDLVWIAKNTKATITEALDMARRAFFVREHLRKGDLTREDIVKYCCREGDDELKDNFIRSI